MFLFLVFFNIGYISEFFEYIFLFVSKIFIDIIVEVSLWLYGIIYYLIITFRKVANLG